MDGNAIRRRRLLATVCGVGSVALAGCPARQLLQGSESGSSYACTDLDDESTERFGAEDTPFPFDFEVPSVMTKDDARSRNAGGRMTFTKQWNQLNPGSGPDQLRHNLELTVKHLAPGSQVRPVLLRGREPSERIIGKRRIDGRPVGLVQREASEDRVRLELWFPVTVDGDLVFRETNVRLDAVIQGDQQAAAEARSNDPNQTCTAALRAVAVDVVDSMSAVSPAETGTTLALTPSTVSVRRGETTQLSVDATGIEWVDLEVDGDGEFDFQGTLRVDDGPVPLTIAPPTDEGGADVVRVADGDRLSTLNSIGPVTPGSYTVRVSGPGTDGTVDETATLTVESA